MATIEELETLVEIARATLEQAEADLRDARIASAPWKEGDIIKDKNGEEAKVLRVATNWSYVVPVVVYRKKSGEWGQREYSLYSWDLPSKTEAA